MRLFLVLALLLIPSAIFAFWGTSFSGAGASAEIPKPVAAEQSACGSCVYTTLERIRK